MYEGFRQIDIMRIKKKNTLRIVEHWWIVNVKFLVWCYYSSQMKIGDFTQYIKPMAKGFTVDYHYPKLKVHSHLMLSEKI